MQIAGEYVSLEPVQMKEEVAVASPRWNMNSGVSIQRSEVMLASDVGLCSAYMDDALMGCQHSHSSLDVRVGAKSKVARPWSAAELRTDQTLLY